MWQKVVVLSNTVKQFGNREVKDKERIMGVRVCSEEYGEGLDRKVTSENVL